MYKGHVLTFPYGNTKGDVEGYRQALAEFHKRKLEIDGSEAWDKPNGRHYQKAIASREKLIKWHEAVGELERAEIYRGEMAELRRRYDAVRNPPALELYDLNPLYDQEVCLEALGDSEFWKQPEQKHTRMDAAWNAWQDRLASVDNRVVEADRTVAALIARYLAEYSELAPLGKVSKTHVKQLTHRLKVLANYCGGLDVGELGSQQLKLFHSHLLGEIAGGKISSSWGRNVFTTTKSFVKWLWESEHTDQLPRNLDKLSIAAELGSVTTWEMDEIAELLEAANERMRLFILLMLNCGMYQSDIAALKHEQVDWKRGRIKRKRTKTETEKNAPMVDYLLWDETFGLLKKHRSGHENLVLVTRTNSPLLETKIGKSGNLTTKDLVGNYFANLARKSGTSNGKGLKHLRKTSASLLGEHETFGKFAQYFLSHSPDSMADRHYVRPSADQFDSALVWLGGQFGMSCDRKG